MNLIPTSFRNHILDKIHELFFEHMMINIIASKVHSLINASITAQSNLSDFVI